MTSENMKVETLMQVRENTLNENYTPHDILQEYLEARLEEAGFEVAQHGTDDRDHDSERISYGDGPDIAVYHDQQLLCYIEVKSKRVGNEDWFGRLNRHHFEEYLWGETELSDGHTDFEGARNIDEDVFLYFGVVDEDDGVVTRDGFLPVRDDGQIEEGFRANGNIVVGLDTSEEKSFNWLFYQLHEKMDDDITEVGNDMNGDISVQEGAEFDGNAMEVSEQLNELAASASRLEGVIEQCRDEGVDVRAVCNDGKLYLTVVDG
jgi:hypothetical protein